MVSEMLPVLYWLSVGSFDEFDVGAASQPQYFAVIAPCL